MMTDALVQLSGTDLRTLGAALRSGRVVLPYSVISLQRALPAAAAERLAKDFQALAGEGFNAVQLARLCDALGQQKEQHRSADDVIEIVTTGPETGSVTNRDTSVVVRELFANASESVLLAGYAVHRGQRVFQALAKRMEERPALKVEFLLDVQRPFGDTTMADVLVKRFSANFLVQNWPEGIRTPEVYFDPRSVELTPEKRASLHAKCVVVDRGIAFISSANFTEAAQEKNIEVGVLIRSPALAEKLALHFSSLLGAGVLKRAL